MRPGSSPRPKPLPCPLGSGLIRSILLRLVTRQSRTPETPQADCPRTSVKHRPSESSLCSLDTLTAASRRGGRNRGDIEARAGATTRPMLVVDAVSAGLPGTATALSTLLDMDADQVRRIAPRAARSEGVRPRWVPGVPGSGQEVREHAGSRQRDPLPRSEVTNPLAQ